MLAGVLCASLTDWFWCWLVKYAADCLCYRVLLSESFLLSPVLVVLCGACVAALQLKLQAIRAAWHGSEFTACTTQDGSQAQRSVLLQKRDSHTHLHADCDKGVMGSLCVCLCSAEMVKSWCGCDAAFILVVTGCAHLTPHHHHIISFPQVCVIALLYPKEEAVTACVWCFLCRLPSA